MENKNIYEDIYQLKNIIDKYQIGENLSEEDICLYAKVAYKYKNKKINISIKELFSKKDEIFLWAISNNISKSYKLYDLDNGKDIFNILFYCLINKNNGIKIIEFDKFIGSRYIAKDVYLWALNEIEKLDSNFFYYELVDCKNFFEDFSKGIVDEKSFYKKITTFNPPKVIIDGRMISNSCKNNVKYIDLYAYKNDIYNFVDNWVFYIAKIKTNLVRKNFIINDPYARYYNPFEYFDNHLRESTLNSNLNYYRRLIIDEIYNILNK